MRLALFVPCYVDQLRPRIGLAALDLLRAAGFDVEVPGDVVCCGQPFHSAGEAERAQALGHRFMTRFESFDAIVVPSGSCVSTLRGHLAANEQPAAAEVAARTFELSEFLVDRWPSPSLPHPIPRRVGLHSSCHALRELRLGTPSETREPSRRDPAAELLDKIPEIDRIDLTRRDECCGFGGLFSVEEEAVSVRMGLDRLEDHARGRAEILTSTDVSCLLHLEGLARKGKQPVEFLHLAELLAASAFGPDWLDEHGDHHDEHGEGVDGPR